MRYCLEGTRVLEFCDGVAGSYAARMLADWGAEVVKIERPSGDALRARPPFFGDLPHPERSCLFFYLNIGKLGVTQNMAAPTGQEIFRKLLHQADIFVEDQPASATGKLGLSYDALSAINPRLVLTSVSRFGRTGPHSWYKAYPLNSYHAGGDGYLLQCGEGYYDREPIKAGGFAGEYESGLSVALATVAARFWQSKTGLGQHVDVSQQEVLMGLNRGFVNQYANDGVSENRASHGYPYGGTLPCKDGYVVIQATHDHMWQRLMELMGSPAWADDERFKDAASREPHGAEINDGLRKWTSTRTRKELCLAGQRLGLPIASFADNADVSQSEQLRSRGFFVAIEHAVVGKVLAPFSPYLTSDAEPRALQPPPLLGQHNEEVYCQRLGYSPQDLCLMRSAGII